MKTKSHLSLTDRITIEEKDPVRRSEALKAIRQLLENSIGLTEAGQHRRLRARMNGPVLNIAPYVPNTINGVIVPGGSLAVHVTVNTYGSDNRSQTLVDFNYNDTWYRIFCR